MKYNLIQNKTTSNSAIEQVLLNRGIENPYHYLNTTIDDLHSEELLNNINEGALLLLHHLEINNRILIIVDSDADGYTSAAILLNYLYKVFPSKVEKNIDYVLHHPKKTHGITQEIFNQKTKEFFNKQNYQLIICPDSASNDFDAHEILSKQNIDVLVLDHHEVEKISNYACIINNQICDYPNKSLSGAGIVYKFCFILDKFLKVEYAKDYLDLAVLGCISDMMDIRDYELKEMINEGLEEIRNPFFKYMVKKQSFSINGCLSPIKISFYVTPFINAVVRSGTLDEKLLLFKSLLEYEALKIIPSNKRGHKPGDEEKLVEQTMRMCTNVKKRQTNEEKKFVEIVIKIIEENNLLDNKLLLIKLENIEIDSNLTGLIANKITNTYQRPTCILNRVIESDGKICWAGSARNYNHSELNNFKDFCSNSGYVELAEGHQSAFGIKILDSNFKNFIQYSNDFLKDVLFTSVYNIDYLFEGSESINPDIIFEIASYKNLWGQNIEEPYILFKNIVIKKDNINLIGSSNNTIRITLKNGLTLMLFKVDEDIFYNFLPFENGYTKVDLLAKCEINDFMGRQTPQCIIQQYIIKETHKILL